MHAWEVLRRISACFWPRWETPLPELTRLPDEQSGKAFFCGRCGVEKTSIRGASCESCKKRHAATESMWKQLKCWKCGKQAVGFNAFGAFCSDEHYPKTDPAVLDLGGDPAPVPAQDVQAARGRSHTCCNSQRCKGQ